VCVCVCARARARTGQSIWACFGEWGREPLHIARHRFKAVTHSASMHHHNSEESVVFIRKPYLQGLSRLLVESNAEIEVGRLPVASMVQAGGHLSAHAFLSRAVLHIYITYHAQNPTQRIMSSFLPGL
jgi:hypothetical protein